jgi:photosynthetic reaction center H subunit
MQHGALTGYIDVAQIALYVFWLFFAGLVYYLRREDKREGYPLVTERPGHVLDGFPVRPPPKVFVMGDGRQVLVPRSDDPEPEINAQPLFPWPGAPLEPLGNPMLSGSGPASITLRLDKAEYMEEVHDLRIVPLRVATDHGLDEESPDSRGHQVVAADGVVAGTVADLWIDRSETLIRYVEVTLIGGGRTVLVPKNLARVDLAGVVHVESILASQFNDAPTLASPNEVTWREEERIQAYFASGHLFATPSRIGPLL